MNTIAIIGGGPAAVSFCMQFVEHFKSQHLTQPIEIIVFEKNTTIGVGLPYSSPSDSYLLNLPKEIMEPIYGNNGNFSHWLQSVRGANQDTQFPPRHYFGKYLECLADKVKREAASFKISINYLTKNEVFDIQEIGANRFEIKAIGGKYISNYIILCTGHMPSSTYRELMGKQGYRHYPWDNDAYKNLNRCDDVGIIGSRLTAIDIACQLHQMKHQGKIFMVSRSGLLPTVLAKKIPHYALKYLTLDTVSSLTNSGSKHLQLDTLFQLFWKEISEAMGKPYSFDLIPKSYKDISPLDWLNYEITQAETGHKPWQQVLFALYPNVSTIWPMLSLADQKLFFEKYDSLYMTYLAAFPLENAYKIQELIKSSQLEVHGGLATIEHGMGHFAMKTEGQIITTKHLFNATGLGYNPTLLPLYNNMMKRGLICKHPLGGIAVDSQSLHVFDQAKKLNTRIFALGELTRGSCLATTDLGRVAVQANKISACLIRNLLPTLFKKCLMFGHSSNGEHKLKNTLNRALVRNFSILKEPARPVRAALSPTQSLTKTYFR
jgi:uncharacterized NAD(P)/FAD-binding protein YdhS